MKKLVSLLALCALCIGAVAMVTACGSKPAKKSVWKVTTETSKRGNQAPDVAKPEDSYICFHSDGMTYYTEKENGKLVAYKMGLYRMDAKEKTMLIGAQDYSYTLEKNSLTLTYSYSDPDDSSRNYSRISVCTLVTSPTEKEIKAVVENR